MTSPRILTLLLPLLFFAVTALAAEDDMASSEDLEKRLLEAHGTDRWDEVTRVAFTFVVAREGNVQARRSWNWLPQTGEVMLTQDDRSTSFTVGSAATEAEKSAESKWINDTFWLYFPVHLKWGTEDALEDKGDKRSPMMSARTRLVTLSYPADGGGVTPGDAYDLYLDPETFRPVEWTFRKGGAAKGSSMTWEGYEEHGPLTVSTMHQDMDGLLVIRMEDVIVETGE